MKLKSNIYKEVSKLYGKGDLLIAQGDYKSAVEMYKKALSKLPEPIEQWDEGKWIYGAIGNGYYMSQNYELALEYFFKALSYEDVSDNLFIVLRVGQCYFDTENMKMAEEYLMKAYNLAGDIAFEREDVKYMKFVKSIKKKLGI